MESLRMVKITLMRIRRMAAGHLGGSHCSPDNGGLDPTGKSGNVENWREPKRTLRLQPTEHNDGLYLGSRRGDNFKDDFWISDLYN